MEGDDMKIFNNAVEIDLHSLRLFDAEVRICEAIEEAWYCGKKSILLVQGYKNGVTIRNFIRNPGGFRKRLDRFYPELHEVGIKPKDYGSPYVTIENSGRKNV